MSQPDIDYQKGIVYFEAKRPFDAATFLSRAATYRPDDFPIHTVLYQVYRQTENEELQLSELYKLIRMDPQRVMRDMPWVFTEAARLAEKMGALQNAAEIYDQYLSFSPPDSIARPIKKKLDEWRVKKLIWK